MKMPLLFIYFLCKNMSLYLFYNIKISTQNSDEAGQKFNLIAGAQEVRLQISKLSTKFRLKN